MAHENDRIVDSVAFANRKSPAFPFAATINTIAKNANIPPCALAAIVEVESGGRNIMQKGMKPGPDCGVGLCQITYGVDWIGANGYYKGRALLDTSWNLEVAAQDFLAPAIAGAMELRNTRARLMQTFNAEILYFVFCIYNAGLGQVDGALADGIDPDRITTDNYGARALDAYHRNCDASHAKPAA